MLLLNQTSCDIRLETSHNNSLRQASYCTTNHPVILSNVCDPLFKKIGGAQPGLKEDQPHHLAPHCCGNLGAHVSVDSLEFSCRYPSASRPITSSKLFIIHLHQSSASEMVDIALGILSYFFFPEIIFSAEILTVHFIDLIL